MKAFSYFIVIVLSASNFLFAQKVVTAEVNPHHINVKFDHPMNKDVLPASAVQIFPSVHGSWRWRGDCELLFTADSSLMDNTLYIVTLSSHLADREGKAIVPYSFYFVNHKEEYQISRVPFQWDDIDMWDTKADWRRGIVYQTIKPTRQSKDKTKASPQYVLYFLWEREFFGPLRDWNDEPMITHQYEIAQQRLTISVFKNGKERWRETLNWQNCLFANADDYVEHIAAAGQTVEGQRLYIFSKTGQTVLKYPVVNCNIIYFSPVGNYLAAASSGNELYLFNVVKRRMLWHKDIPDSVEINTIAVSNDGEVMVLLEKNDTKTHAHRKTLILYDQEGEMVWQYAVSVTHVTEFSIRFTTDNQYFLVYNDNRLSCYKIIRFSE